MCSPEIGATAARVVTGTVTMGGSELIRKVPGPIGQIGGSIAKIPESLTYQTLGGKSEAQKSSEASTTEAAKATQEAAKIGPVQTSPAVTDISAKIQAEARKRRNTLAAGILSTIGTSPKGTTGTLVSKPQAFASGMKTALGQ